MEPTCPGGDLCIRFVQKLKVKKFLKTKAKDWFVTDAKLSSLRSELTKLQNILLNLPMDLETAKKESDTRKLILNIQQDQAMNLKQKARVAWLS